MKPTRRPSVCLVTETGMFLQTSSPLISHCLRLMVRVVDCMVCDSVVNLLSDHFDSNQSMESVDLPFTCHPSPSLNTIAFRSSEVRRLFLYLDFDGGTDPLGMFPRLRRELMFWFTVSV